MRIFVTLFVVLFVAPAALGQDLFVFPNDGQGQDQQDMDTFQCQRAATDRTGFDPMATPTATTRPPDQKGGVVGGAARGAANDVSGVRRPGRGSRSRPGVPYLHSPIPGPHRCRGGTRGALLLRGLSRAGSDRGRPGVVSAGT